MSQRQGEAQPASSSVSHDPALSIDASRWSYAVRPSVAHAQISTEMRHGDARETHRPALPPISTLAGLARSPSFTTEQNSPGESGIYGNLNPRYDSVIPSLPDTGRSRFVGTVTSPAQYSGRPIEEAGSASHSIASSHVPRTYDYRQASPTRSLGARAASYHGFSSDFNRSPPPSPHSREQVIPFNVSLAPPSQGGSLPTHTTPYSLNPRAPTAASTLQMRSLSASPSTTYSSYSQPSLPSPAEPIRPHLGSRQSSYSHLPTLPAPGSLSGSPLGAASAGEADRPYGGSGSYQFVTRETADGPVQFAVEVASGSRVADEKRKRNAGASARFRARRKEKEKEAATRISELQRHIQDLSEDADFYRQERDYFAGIVFRGPERDRHFPRAPSPRRLRMMQSQHRPPPLGTQQSMVYQELRDVEGEGRTAKRRLTQHPSHSNLRQADRLTLPPPPLPPYHEPSPGRAPSPALMPQPGAPLPFHEPRRADAPHIPPSEPGLNLNLPVPQPRPAPPLALPPESRTPSEPRTKEQAWQSSRRSGRR